MYPYLTIIFLFFSSESIFNFFGKSRLLIYFYRIFNCFFKIFTESSLLIQAPGATRPVIANLAISGGMTILIIFSTIKSFSDNN